VAVGDRLGAATGAAAAGPTYTVGIGKSTDGYTAATRAIQASGQWPGARITGNTVVVKPNLVTAATTDTGTTTDPQVVRAVVDRAFAGGASRVLIVEGGVNGPCFDACGYGLFRSYDPLRRIELVDLNAEPLTLTTVPGGSAYAQLYLGTRLVAPGTVFISVAKLKTHGEVGVTLGMKNLFGLPPVAQYAAPDQPQWRPRYRLHDRGVHQVIVDLLLTRPVDFAVVDGIWGMEGLGPATGTPVRSDVVLAGANVAAVDRACLWAMQFPQDRVQYLTYAALRGLGPSGLDQVVSAGDAHTPQAYAAPGTLPPMAWQPSASPTPASTGQAVTIGYRIDDKAGYRLLARVEVIQTSETSPDITQIATLRDWASRAPGTESLIWDLRDATGQPVVPGTYVVRVLARHEASPMLAIGTTRITVQA